MFEQLTGVKINVVELQFPDLYSKAVAEPIAGSGASDVSNYSPSWILDLAQSGVLEPLDSYMDKYMNKSEIDDIAPWNLLSQTYRRN